MIHLHMCEGKVFDGRAGHHICLNVAKYCECGHWYCWQHAPSKKAQREEKRMKKREEEQEKRQKWRASRKAKERECEQRVVVLEKALELAAVAISEHDSECGGKLTAQVVVALYFAKAQQQLAKEK